MRLTRRQVVVGAATTVVSWAGSHGPLKAAGNGSQNSLRGPIKAVRVGTPLVVPDNAGDTWVAAWGDDGNLYSPSNDTAGFHGTELLLQLLPELTEQQRSKLKAGDTSVWKEFTQQQLSRIEENGPASTIAFNRVFGEEPGLLRGETVNWMRDFARQDRVKEVPNQFNERIKVGADGCTWKSSGCAFIDGVLYWAIARHNYGELSGDPHKRQTAINASLIKSVDHGRTWTRSAEENLTAPMFPGSSFAAPYFIDYGRTLSAVDDADRYIYAVSNNGFWDNGDRLILGRVRRDRISRLQGADWEFLGAADATRPAAWSSKADDAKPILDRPGKLGMSGVTYLPHRRRYMLIGWYYPAGGGKMKGAHSQTIWEFYEAPKPWGPWIVMGTTSWSPQGYYCPCISPKFQSADRIHVMTAGDWTNSSVYRLTLVPVDLV